MNQPFTTTILHLLCALLLPLAPATAADHFDIASIKPAQIPKPIRRHSPSRITYEGIGFEELITKAFALPQHQIIWPDWVWGVPKDHPSKEKPEGHYFTIKATMPPTTTPAEFQSMLQNLLMDRFGLAFHKETRPLTQYELAFAKGGPKMPLAKTVDESPPPNLPDDNENLTATKHWNRLNLLFGQDGVLLKGDLTPAGIAAQFSQWLRHPLVDRTGSTAYYAIEFRWSWNPYSTPPFEPGMTNRAADIEAKELFTEMEKKLGLKVTLRTVPTQFLVIDRLNREPTPN